MQKQSDWLKILRKISPIITVVSACIALVCARYGLFQINIAESIIIGLIILLAIDTYVERLGYLERIEIALTNKTNKGLRSREELPPVEEQAEHASEICIISPAMSTLIYLVPTFFEKKVKSNCKFRILLLNPDDELAVQTWRILVSKTATNPSRINDTVKTLNEITAIAPQNCEIKFSKIFIPFSMFATDLSKNSGTMVIEYHGYKAPDDIRPHVFLRNNEDHKWFAQYTEMFENAWKDGNNVQFF